MTTVAIGIALQEVELQVHVLLHPTSHTVRIYLDELRGTHYPR